MFKGSRCACLGLLMLAGGAWAQEAPTDEVQTLPGMSILGNHEAPTSLVIVPWRSSELGAAIGLGDSLNARSRPVDREVFLRELRYYEIRSGE